MDDHNLDALQMKSQLDQALQDSEPESSHREKHHTDDDTQHDGPTLWTSILEPFPNDNSEHKTDANMAYVHWIHKQLANAHQPWSPSPTKD